MSFVDDIATLVAASRDSLIASPSNWKRVPLGQVAQIVNGFAFSSSRFNRTSGMVVARIRDVVRGHSETYYEGSVDGAPSIDDGDLLVGMDGDFNAATWRGGRAVLNQRVCKVMPDEKLLNRRFLGFVLPAYLRLINEKTPSTTVKHLSSRTLAQIPLPLPTLDLQERIAAKIDELFIEIGDGEEELRRAGDELETYRQSLLMAAVSGALTADWRANRPLQTASVHDEWPLWLGRRSRVPEPSPEQKALKWNLPDGWIWSQIGSTAFVTKLAGFEYTKHVRYAEDGDLPVLKAENAGPRGFRPTNYSRVHSGSVRMLTRSRLHGGEILVVFVGAGTGNVATVPDAEEFFLGPNIGMVRPAPFLNPRYLELFLRSPGGKGLLLASMKAVAQPSLSMATIRQTPLALPAREEQDAIVSCIDAATSAANEIPLASVTAHSAALRQSILAAAFGGGLVQ